MTCSACSSAVENTLRSLKGVASASVSLTQGMAEVHVDTLVIQPVGRGIEPSGTGGSCDGLAEGFFAAVVGLVLVSG